MGMNLLALIQVRDGSKRLPGKALAEVNGLPIIQHIWNRVLACKELDGAVVSTSVESPEVVGYCKRNGIPHYVGSETDLLSRHLSALLTHNGDAMLRVTGDELFIDPAILDQMASDFREWKYPPLINWHHDQRAISEGLDT